ncbi:putative ribonuclease H-like superfamily, hAT-like transposase, RNase-H [Helianthus annuus]|uniref:Ribonuclease H-like superfamily, hAT-like transposase, RNase-H n=1 Tax=Helianthus annuus TaxID=4232 RepID=A0A9K3N6C2_HELAN|nr:putative ribonuclease H-like superfamily, hAT-like transposase, RNase-H [Helianthus annuus]KAJ0891333.1 putative ribonuclease H-like superfamily, hAT-like transposase, RNase-H [Helianthus annuus]
MENNYHVDCLGKAVRYIRNSTQRITKFKKCMVASDLESTKFLCEDLPTRWNSTYEMLKTAVDLRDIYFSYKLEDSGYNHDLERLPEHSDFGACEKLVKFLENFKTKTEIVSSPSKPLAHLFFREILDVNKHLWVWDCDPTFSTMITSMREKYDKY